MHSLKAYSHEETGTCGAACSSGGSCLDIQPQATQLQPPLFWVFLSPLSLLQWRPPEQLACLSVKAFLLFLNHNFICLDKLSRINSTILRLLTENQSPLLPQLQSFFCFLTSSPDSGEAQTPSPRSHWPWQKPLIIIFSYFLLLSVNDRLFN